jgi:hypothetical protein
MAAIRLLHKQEARARHECPSSRGPGERLAVADDDDRGVAGPEDADLLVTRPTTPG